MDDPIDKRYIACCRTFPISRNQDLLCLEVAPILCGTIDPLMQRKKLSSCSIGLFRPAVLIYRCSQIFLARLCGQVERYKDVVSLPRKSSRQVDMLELLNGSLIPNADYGESTVFYYKSSACFTGLPLKGDYGYYLAEFASGEKRILVVLRTKPTSQGVLIRDLELALNFSIFYYKILNSYDRAWRVAKPALDEVIAEPDITADGSGGDSIPIMHLFYDNLTLWELSESNKGEGAVRRDTRCSPGTRIQSNSVSHASHMPGKYTSGNGQGKL
ncbi:14-3-3 domain-containing protein [Mariannaea sp. PMI_226]|nr:14-3-3 domain-containing protein [Mariannaea sp. PMI_226]